MSEFRPPTYVANVIHPRPGGCFRWVYGNGRNDYPAPCPASAIWRAVVLDPKGRRVDVYSCDEHTEGLVKRRQIT